MASILGQPVKHATFLAGPSALSGLVWSSLTSLCLVVGHLIGALYAALSVLWEKPSQSTVPEITYLIPLSKFMPV